MYVYIFDGYDCYTVGHYQPDGTWEPESDHHTAQEAAERVRYLNGGTIRSTADEIAESVRIYGVGG